jgi:eukaryotic-like serine/threonine-protein kinase
VDTPAPTSAPTPATERTLAVMDTTVTDPLLGVVLDGRYRVDAVLAHGGMSTVYTGTDLRLDRPVAVKVMSPSFAKDPAFVQQFTREARSVARLTHPNVVPVFDQGKDGDHVFLVMELVRGRTLRHLLRERGRLPADLAVSVLEPVLAALAAAHRAGLVHRDVKPENVLLGADGTVKVVDFGLARAVATATGTATATQTGAVMGTVAYVAPELVSRGTADTRSDVYSAGILLYEMLTGAPPYVGETAMSVAYRHVHEDVPRPSVSAPGLPSELDGLVLRATARRPVGRPADAEAFLAALRGVRDRLGLRTVTVPPPVGRETAPPPAAGHGADPLQRTRALHQPPAAPPRPHAAPAAATGPGRLPPVVPEHDEQRAHRRRGLIGLVVILMLGAAGAGAGWSYGVWRHTRVPALQGMTRAEAVAVAQRAHLRVRSQTAEVFDEDVRPGLVAGSRPGQGYRVVRNRAITLLISKGPAPRTVPDLSGKSRDDALQALSELRLAATVERVFSTVRSGRVAGTDPPRGATVRRGSMVTVLVSRGRLPNTTGQPQGDAVDTLRAAGLDVQVRQEFNDDVAEGAVVSQDPSGGTVREGATVTLVVSRGPESIRVPNVIGSKLDDARKRLEDLGFHVQVESLFGGPTRTVVAQAPIAGLKARRGSTIRLGIV